MGVGIVKKGIIFDLDGTLWEVTDVTLDSVNKIAIKYSLEKVTKSTVRSVFGLNKEESSQKFFPKTNKQ